MANTRQCELYIAQTAIPLPCFFPSVSSVKTNLMPVDYLELLTAAVHPLFLVSAYDIANIANSPDNHRLRIDAALHRSKENGTAILMDSGKYEGFWKADAKWVLDSFHEIVRCSKHHLCFCYDNQEPSDNVRAIADDVVLRVLRDQKHALGTVVPIVHGATELLAATTKRVAEQLCPVLLAVPERALGEGIIARIQTVTKIRRALNELDFYCPLHLLGTGNPLSVIVYAMAGVDSFDGLEWCQTVVDHKSGKLFHFQQWDLFRHQTEWGENGKLPYIQSVLMHNLEFYRQLMDNLRYAIKNEATEDFLRKYATDKQTAVLLNAIEAGE